MADFIDQIIQEEGGAKATNDPADAGGRTQYGISEAAHPEAWVDDKVTLEEARAIYSQEYLIDSRINTIPFIPLQDNVLDFAVHAGIPRAEHTLQAILGVERDGVLGPLTLAALAARDAKEVNNLYVAARRQFYYHLAQVRPANKKFLKGWLKRAQSYFLP